MIPRYTRKKMGEIWSDENRFKTWLRVEIEVLRAKEELGEIPSGVAQKVKDKAVINLRRIKEIEKITGHDLMAFIRSVSENLDKVAAQHFHAGITSYDIEDTSLALFMKKSIDILVDDVKKLLEALKIKVWKHKDTLEIGRTHGVHAEPITFGFKLANWYDETERQLERLRRLKEMMAVGKISGAVGTYANIDPRIEKIVCQNLGLNPARISTQIISRDRHAEYLFTLGLIGGSLDKFATEIRNLQRTEISEVQEGFKAGQKGSSAMPHKKNPVNCENVCSLTRLLKGFVITALENQLTWHERDLVNSGNERIIIADASITLDFMLVRFTKIIENLVVYPEKMLENLNLTRGLIYSQKVMLALARKGMPREKAHDLTQELALKTWEEKSDFKKVLLQNKTIGEFLTRNELAQCFDPHQDLKHIDKIFKRFEDAD